MKLVGVAVIAALCVAPVAARAQSAKAAAETAFRKGKDLMAAGDLPAACTAFEESEKLDAQLGTQYNLALCYEKLGKLTSAWINFTEVAAKDGAGGRKDDSARRAKALEPRLTRMMIAISAPVTGEVVRVGAVDVSVLAGTPSPIDEGSYEVTATAPGFAPWHGQVELRGAGKVVTIDVPALEPASTLLPPRDTEAAPPPRDDPGRGRKLGAYALGGAGVIVIGVGGYFGLHAHARQSDAEAACGGDVLACPADQIVTARNLTGEARDSATIADLAVAGGVAIVIGAVAMYLTAPDGSEASASEATTLAPVIGPDQVGLGMSGHF